METFATYSPNIRAHARFSVFTLVQFAAFCTVGVLNTLVDIGSYFVLTRYLFPDGGIIAAKALSYLAATVSSFTINRHWTFGKRSRVQFSEIRKFYTTVALGIFVNVGAQYVAVHLLGINDLISVLLAAFVTGVWGFSFSKWYVFK
ncbi:MAG: GtrA family protein [Minisyncoccia bacterium]